MTTGTKRALAKEEDECKVLVADDELSIRSVLAQTLSQQSIQVFRAQSGKTALNRTKEKSIDVAVLDILMPGDGIETAAKIQEIRPEVRIIFLTAFDNPEHRDRAAKAGVRAERWIDKGSLDWISKVTAAVEEAFDRRTGLLAEQVISWAQEHSIEISKLEGLIKKLEPMLWGEPPNLVKLSPASEENALSNFATLSFEEVLYQLKLWLDELKDGFSDIARRYLAWKRFSEITETQLWESCEKSGADSYRMQLADQLIMAVGVINSHQLDKKFLQAIALSIERLRSENVGPNDVHDCEKVWRLSNIDTLPSFSRVLAELDKLYNLGEEDEGESVSGNNNPDQSLG